MNAEEEKTRLFEIISGHMRINGSEYCSTSEFESDIEDAAEEIYNELATLRAQLEEAKDVISQMYFAITPNKHATLALLEAQRRAYQYLDSVKSGD